MSVDEYIVGILHGYDIPITPASVRKCMRGGIVFAGVPLMLIGLFGWMLVFFSLLIGAVLFCLAVPLFFAGLILFTVGLAVSPSQQQVIVATQQASSAPRWAVARHAGDIRSSTPRMGVGIAAIAAPLAPEIPGMAYSNHSRQRRRHKQLYPRHSLERNRCAR